MKLFKYMAMSGLLLGLSMLAGCSGGEDAASKVQSAEQMQANTNEEEPKSVGVLGHFAGQINMAREAKKMQEEANRKQEEFQKNASE